MSALFPRFVRCVRTAFPLAGKVTSRNFGGSHSCTRNGDVILNFPREKAQANSLALSLLPKSVVVAVQLFVSHPDPCIEDKRQWQVMNRFSWFVSPEHAPSYHNFVQDVSGQFEAISQRLEEAGFPDTVLTVSGAPGCGKSFFIQLLTKCIFKSDDVVNVPTKDSLFVTASKYLNVDPLNPDDQHKSHVFISQVAYDAQKKVRSSISETCMPRRIKHSPAQIIFILEREMTEALMTRLTTEQREGGAPMYTRYSLMQKLAQSQAAKDQLESELSPPGLEDGSCTALFIKNDGTNFVLSRVVKDGIELADVPEDIAVYLETLRKGGESNC